MLLRSPLRFRISCSNDRNNTRRQAAVSGATGGSPVAMTATVGGVPQKRGLISAAGQERILAAQARREAAEAEYREAILAEAARGASVRELAAFTGLSTNTISRWKRAE